MSRATHRKLRRFDHEEAIRLRTENPALWTIERLAEHFGVSTTGIERVVNPNVRARLQRNSERQIENMRQPCIRCGKPGVWRHQKQRSGLCNRCAGALVASPNVRENELRCTKCEQWKPDADFGQKGGSIARRGRRTWCRACESAARREFRHRHPEQERRTANRYYNSVRRERLGSAMEYIVLKHENNGAGEVWREVARPEAPTPDAAIEKSAKDEGTYVAIVATRWEPVPVEPIMSLRVLRTEEAST